jgi:hypothetical protein
MRSNAASSVASASSRPTRGDARPSDASPRPVARPLAPPEQPMQRARLRLAAQSASVLGRLELVAMAL